MNFVRYNPSDGTILNMGWGPADSIQKEIDEGMPTIVIDQIIQWGEYRVNLETKQLEPIPAPEPTP
jgi:hypothetical protein